MFGQKRLALRGPLYKEGYTMASSRNFSSVDDALAWLNAGGHGIQSVTVELNVGGRWMTFKNYADGLLRKNDWAAN